jgi:aspartyl-tRNA(Asn)/glutamyl-tRNA(Gln) amidotransferase subunit B
MTLVDVRISEPKRYIPGATGDWEVIIGLEVHAQVTSNSKLFSGASTTFGNAPNSNVSLVDAAMPGMLPVINEECVKQAVRTGLGLKAQINKRSIFDRKNYFYPDLPQGYQISQFKDPIVGEGKIVISVGPDRQGQFEDIEIGIERLHLEQDAGKSMHDQSPTMSYVDLNRSGVALMEIVSKPDMRSSDEAKAYVTKLRSIVRYLGTCDGNMDEGSMRADVNVSVRRPGEDFGTRCEIKNVNSIRFIGQAIEYEARRQIGILEDGGTIDQETRLFDPNKGETRSMRSKEDAHDYRYFPDPDLLPLEFDDAFVEELKAHLPELPDDKKERFVRDLGLSIYDASVLVSEKAIADYFEAVAAGRDGKIAANWVINDLLGALNKAGKDIEETPVSPAQLGGIHRSHQVGSHLRQDRQGPVRDRLDRRRRPGRVGRKPRHEAGHRYRRHRKGRRRDHCCQPRPGRQGPGQAFACRLVRRPGDEGNRRQGQPAGGASAGQGQARHRGRVFRAHSQRA